VVVVAVAVAVAVDSTAAAAEALLAAVVDTLRELTFPPEEVTVVDRAE
jgi:hypothetical protein